MPSRRWPGRCVYRFAGNPSVPFVSLPVDLGLSVAPFSLVTRAGAQMTPSAQRLIEAVLAA